MLLFTTLVIILLLLHLTSAIPNALTSPPLNHDNSTEELDVFPLPCKDITLIYARRTNERGNVGNVGAAWFAALRSALEEK